MLATCTVSDDGLAPRILVSTALGIDHSRIALISRLSVDGAGSNLASRVVIERRNLGRSLRSQTSVLVANAAGA